MHLLQAGNAEDLSIMPVSRGLTDCCFFLKEKAAKRTLSSKRKTMRFLHFCPVTILRFGLRNRMKRCTRAFSTALTIAFNCGNI